MPSVVAGCTIALVLALATVVTMCRSPAHQTNIEPVVVRPAEAVAVRVAQIHHQLNAIAGDVDVLAGDVMERQALACQQPARSIAEDNGFSTTLVDAGGCLVADSPTLAPLSWKGPCLDEPDLLLGEAPPPLRLVSAPAPAQSYEVRVYPVNGSGFLLYAARPTD